MYKGIPLSFTPTVYLSTIWCRQLSHSIAKARLFPLLYRRSNATQYLLKKTS